MKTLAFIILGIIIGLGLVFFWPWVLAAGYIASMAMVAVLMVAGQILFYAIWFFAACWVAIKLVKVLYPKDKKEKTS